MQNTKLFDDTIKEVLSDISDSVEASEKLRQNVYQAIQYQNKKEIPYMKKRFALKRVMILAAVLCLIVVTVFAAGHIKSYYSSSSGDVAYTSFPTQNELKKDLGFVPDAVSAFSNGYTFDKAVIGETTPIGEDGKEMGNYKFIHYRYVSDKNEGVNLSVNKQMPGETLDPMSQETEYKGTGLFYLSQNYKFVPPDYVLTEEDEIAQESGDIVFSYGSETVEEKVIQSLSWTDGELSYNLMAMDGSLTKSELIGMASEIIDLAE